MDKEQERNARSSKSLSESGINDQDVKELEKGIKLIKVKEDYVQSEDNHRLLRLDLANRRLIATTKEFLKKEKTYQFSIINELKNGFSTDIIKKLQYKKGAPVDIDKKGFVIIYDDYKKNLNFLARDEATRDKWVSVINSLLKDVRDGRLSTNFHNHSAIADKSKDNIITKDEAIAYLNKLNIKLKKNDIKNLIKISDKNNDGKLNTEEFESLINQLYFRKEMISLFKLIADLQEENPPKKFIPEYVSWYKFKLFLQLYQKEDKSDQEIKDIIKKYDPDINSDNSSDDDIKLSQNGLTLYLNDQLIQNQAHQVVYQDMNRTFASYFTSSSHNTYLTGDQLTSTSQAEGYIAAIMKGARLLEMDCYDGSDGQPRIYHHNTLTSKILFEEAVKAIRDYAFKLTEYEIDFIIESKCFMIILKISLIFSQSFPLILTLELHCSREQQRTMASLIKIYLKDYIYHGYDGVNYPTINELKKKVILRCRRSRVETNVESPEMIKNESIKRMIKEASKTSIRSFDSETSTSEIDPLDRMYELTEFINLLQNASFKGVDHAFENFTQVNTSSISEPKMKKIFESETPENLIKYTSSYLAKIYPGYYRTGSSNFNPMDYWIYGFQMAALNFQTDDTPMELNEALFNDNGNCGYVLKPDILLDPKLGFNPLNTSTMKNKRILEIKIISGQNLPRARDLVKDITDPYVKVSIFGVPSDYYEKKTKSIKDNGVNPIWNHDFKFLINCPELAIVRFSVRDDDVGKDQLIGNFAIRLLSMKSGYRHIRLKNKESKGTLFVGIKIEPVNKNIDLTQIDQIDYV